MFSKKTVEKTKLDDAIEEVYRQMESLTADSAEYAKMVIQLDALYKIKSQNKDKNSVELKDWIPVIGSVGGILVIIIYESMGHSMTSKAMSFVKKS